MKNSKENLTLLIMLSILGLYLIFVFLSPMKVEIIPTETEMQAHIYKRSVLHPFKDEFVPNVITATINSKRQVELKDTQGHRHQVTSRFFYSYDTEYALQDKINNSIQNRTPFKCTMRPVYIYVIVFLLALIFFAFSKIFFYRLLLDREEN